MNLDLDSYKKKVGNKEEGLWLLSFCDLSFILLSFFVLLLSQSKIDRSKVEQISEQVTEKKPKEKTDEPRNLVELSNELEKIVKKLNIQDRVNIDRSVDGVAVEFKEGLVFQSGSSTPNSEFGRVTGAVMKVIANSPKKYVLTLEGHTDDVPIRTARFQDNWELSAARSHELMRHFKNIGVAEERMSLVSLAHTRPKVPYQKLLGSALEQARMQNRRVVIRIN